MANSTIKQRCRAGQISVREFIDVAAFKPVARTHLLDVGDFVVMPSLIRTGLDIERIAKLDYLEPGDFRTTRNTTGSISLNVFIKLGPRGDYTIIQGDRPCTGEGSVHYAVRKFQELARENCN